MPTDMTATTTKRETVTQTRRVVVLEPDENVIFKLTDRGGYQMLLCVAMCEHQHKTPEKAWACKVVHDRAKRIANPPPTTPGATDA